MDEAELERALRQHAADGTESHREIAELIRGTALPPHEQLRVIEALHQISYWHLHGTIAVEEVLNIIFPERE